MAYYLLKYVWKLQHIFYFIDNVKFHLDKVEHLGNFVEIEAISNKYMSSIKVNPCCFLIFCFIIMIIEIYLNRI